MLPSSRLWYLMTRANWSTIFLTLILLPAFSLSADDVAPRDRYALHLEARPAATFPFLDQLGKVEIEVYPQGVRANSHWLDGFLRTGENTIRIENPALRLYSDASFEGLRSLFGKLRPEDEKSPSFKELKVVETGRRGTIKKLPARCRRIVLGKDAWIDVWTTTALARNPAYERLQIELLSAISPKLTNAMQRIPGTVLHVVINTRNHPETVLLTTREFYLSSAGHEEALETGRFFLKAPSLDRLLK